MSVHMVYYKDGAKMMRPVLTREEYLALRGSEKQKAILKTVRDGDERQKHRLVQMNYSCLPNEDGSLKGSTTMSMSVGMDIDFEVPEGLSAEERGRWLKERMAEVPQLVLGRREELGLLMLERSATKGYHLVFRRRPELSQEENLRWASEVLGVEFDERAKDITRVFFTTTASEGELLFLDDELFCIASPDPALSKPSPALPVMGEEGQLQAENSTGSEDVCGEAGDPSRAGEEAAASLSYNGIPYAAIIRKWWDLYNEGKEPVRSNRDVLTFELAVNLRHICGFDRAVLDAVIPCYDGFSETQKLKCIDSALTEKRTQMPKRLKDVLFQVRRDLMNEGRLEADECVLDDAVQEDECFYYRRLPRLPQGVRESVEAVGPQLSMPVVTAICPAIGMLATGVMLDVHGQKKGLNLISYIAGDFASGKGSIDPVIDAWMSEVRAMDMMYQQQEEDWRRKKRAAKNKKEQPEEPCLPVRCLPLNNTVANLAERLANTEGKHAFSFTPEADTVAQKWKSAMSDFSVMLRQSYDGSRYDREARSADAVNVHIEHLLWNVCMCGTPDALYRVVSNYTDGFQSRIAVARTPDNTFAPLEEKPHVLTPRQQERIQQVAHLLPLMQGEVVLPKLEAKGRVWLETIRLETIKSDDKVRARQRFRICVTAQRMTCCLMLCRVCEQLVQNHGSTGAENLLKQRPDLWRQMLLKAQTPQLLGVFDVLADYLLETALYFFRERIELAFSNRDYAGGGERQRMGKNDSIFERLGMEFGFEGAFQHSVAVKGAGVSRNSVRQMLKNWKRQGLIVQVDAGCYRKLATGVS
ncbi:MAG: DUF3987 domain-containing protein [Bacteroidaceae bacterium]|nr:DUF3987 domain-containing protein [Bacteroidaceae bacterium]